jgi:hypothetical protein
MAEKKERENREIDLKRQEVAIQIKGSCPSFLFLLMAELSWLALEVTREHLQNLVSKGYMTAVEFATCLVPVDPISPTPTKGYAIVYDFL